MWVATLLVFSYEWLVPLMLWLVLLKIGSAQSAFVESVCLYGYSLSVLVPVCILWTIPLPWLRLVLQLGFFRRFFSVFINKKNRAPKKTVFNVFLLNYIKFASSGPFLCLGWGGQIRNQNLFRNRFLKYSE